MNTATLAYRAPASVAARPAGIVERARHYLAVRRLARDIFVELDALSDRDLADIGLVRFNLRDVAREAAAAAL